MMSDTEEVQPLAKTNDASVLCTFCKSIFLQPRMAGGFVTNPVDV